MKKEIKIILENSEEADIVNFIFSQIDNILGKGDYLFMTETSYNKLRKQFGLSEYNTY